MLRGELAVAALVLFTLAMLFDVFTGNGESFGTWLSIVGVSALLTIGGTVINSLVKRKPEKNEPE